MLVIAMSCSGVTAITGCMEKDLNKTYFVHGRNGFSCLKHKNIVKGDTAA